MAFANKYGVVVAGGEGLDGGAGCGDARGADEDHLERAAGEFGFGLDDGGVDLASVGVTFDGDVEGGEGLLRGVGNVLRKQYDSGAGSEGGGLVNEVLEEVEEAALLEELEHGGGLAAGHDEAVQSFEIGGQSNQLRRGAQLCNGLRVSVVGSLQGKDPDGEFLLGWCGAAGHTPPRFFVQNLQSR